MWNIKWFDIIIIGVFEGEEVVDRKIFKEGMVEIILNLGLVVIFREYFLDYISMVDSILRIK